MPPSNASSLQVQRLIVMASSTGGTRVIRYLMQDIALKNCAIFITQHLAMNADRLFSISLSRIAGMRAILPAPSDVLQPGKIYISPCGRHLRLDARLQVTFDNGPQVNFVKPSADVTMLSLCPAPNREILGIILTGIGQDGAEGIRHIKDIGGRTIAQSPRTCTIKDMPENAIATGCVDEVLTPDRIRQAILSFDT